MGFSSAGALDRDEFLAGTSFAGSRGGGNGTCDFLSSHLVKGSDLVEIAGLAISRRDGDSAARPAGKAAVHPVSVGIVGDDEDALLRLRSNDATQGGS